MRATQTAWNSLSHLEEATLHPGLFKRLRALVVVCFSDCSDGGGSVGPVPWLGHCWLELDCVRNYVKVLKSFWLQLKFN